MTEHSELGASGCKRWWNCPGSVRLTRGIPSRDTPHSRAGTAAHKVAEMCLRLSQKASCYVNCEVEGVTVDAAMADAVQIYVDDGFSVHHDGLIDTRRWLEKLVSLEKLNPPAPMFGTADFVAYLRGAEKLYVKDYKNGRTFVPAKDNPQLRYYALGALLDMPPESPVREVEMTIVQPNALGDPVRRDTISAIDLMEWGAELMERAAATQVPDAPLVPGEWCQFCPAAGTCPGRGAKMLQAAQMEFSNLEPPPVSTLKPQQLETIALAADNIRAWLADVESAVMSMLAAGTKFEHVKRVATEGRPTWRDEAEAETMLALLEVPDVWQPQKLKSVAQIRDQIVDLALVPGDTKKDRKTAAAKMLRGLTYTPRNGVKLVPSSHPSPAIVAGGSEFTAIEGDTPNE